MEQNILATAAVVLASLWFWVPVVIITMFFLAHDEIPIVAIATVILLGVTVVVFATKIEWTTVLSTAAVYVAIGLVFTFVKWWTRSRRKGREFATYVKARLNEKAEDYEYEQIARSWVYEDHLTRVRWLPEEQKWDVTYVKGDLISACVAWTIYWPLYALLILLEDFLKEFWHWFLDFFGGIYNRIATSAYNSAKPD